MEKPTLFVGSSSEGIEISRAIQFQLRDAASVSIWNEGVFGLSQCSLESLVSSLDCFDFAVLVITPDDIVISREVEAQTPRDNVMFELGLFMGGLGRTRTFGVCSNAPEMKLPSDLAGVSLARYDIEDAQRDLTSALGPACYQIREAIRKLGPVDRPRDNAEEVVAEAFFRIQVDVSGLAAEMQGEHHSTQTDWKRTLDLYVGLCHRYRKAGINELIAAVRVYSDLRDSVEHVREIVTTGFAETISILESEQPIGEGFKERFNEAAERLWLLAREVRGEADELMRGV